MNIFKKLFKKNINKETKHNLDDEEELEKELKDALEKLALDKPEIIKGYNWILIRN